MTESQTETGGQPLIAGQRVRGYRVLVVLHQNEFAVTYRADHKTLGDVVLREYMPKALAQRAGLAVEPNSNADWEPFAWGLKRFQLEGKSLARLRHSSVERVLDYFEHGNTGYLAMDYEQGLTLGDRMYRRGGTLDEAELTRVLLPLADGLRQVHAKGFWHGDIRPQNVVLRRNGKPPLLVNFGGARHALGHRSGWSESIVAPGYSAPELYANGDDNGPWTDIYALSALGYAAIVGTPPLAAPARVEGTGATPSAADADADSDDGAGEAPAKRSWSLGRLFARAKAAAASVSSSVAPPPEEPSPDLPPLPERLPEAVQGVSKPLLQALAQGLAIDVGERPQSVDEWLAQVGADGDAAAPTSSTER